jgi:hypothetical protein
MSEERSQWREVKNNYLNQIREKLTFLDHPRRSEILNNVKEHLERKYAELDPGNRTWESFQQIILDMGPPADYATLMCDDIRAIGCSRFNWKTLINVIFVTIVLALGTCLIIYIQKTTQSSPSTETQSVKKSVSKESPKSASGQQTQNNSRSDQISQVLQPAKDLPKQNEQVPGDLQPKTPFVEKPVSKEPVKQDILPEIQTGKPVAFIIRFKSKNPSELKTPDELLGAFNKNYPGGVRTHHFRTQMQNQQLIGHICVDDKSGVSAIEKMLAGSNTLDYLDAFSATAEQYESYCRSGQISPAQQPFDDRSNQDSISSDSPRQRGKSEISEPGLTAEPAVYGKWIAVDYVRKVEDFVPNQRQWKKTLILRELQFVQPSTVFWGFNNNVLKQTFFGDYTVESVNGHSAKYTRKTLEGEEYLFIEWTTLEVTEKGQLPWYYVLKREQIELFAEANGQQSAEDTPEVVDNPNVLGKWACVDFVRNMEDFDPSQRSWGRSFFLTGLDFQNNRQVWFSFSNNSRFKHSWTQGRVDSGEFRPALYVVKNISGDMYMFFEWINGDVITRGQKPSYYVLKKTTTSPAFANSGFNRDIVIGTNYCTMDFIESKFGQAARKEERMLRYPAKGVDFWFSIRGILSEIHFNQGYQGQLKTGISLTSTMQDVFQTYGMPVKTLEAADLHRKNDERILYQKDDTSRIYYGRQGLIFWFRDGVVLQIVVFKGEIEL